MSDSIRVGFDAVPLANDKMTGIGWCEAGQTEALGKLFPNDKYSYNLFRCPTQEQTESAIKRLNGFSHGNIDVNYSGFLGRIYRVLTWFLPIPYNIFFEGKNDIEHFFNYIVPPLTHGKAVVTVHDMIYKRYPETVRFRTKLNLKIALKRSMRRAEVIVTDSEFSKKEISYFYPKYASKIKVVPCGVDRNHFKPCDDIKRISTVKEKYQISGDYFLYVGTLEPRKNIPVMIDAFCEFVDNCKTTEHPKLVITGQKGWLYDSIFEKVKERNVESDIIFTEYVSSEDINPLMCGAKAFVYPSIYEGFGMPPLEAMSCGVPVIVSDAASLPEVVGDAAILCKPDSTDAFREAFLKITSDEQLRESMIQKGLQRAEELSWEASALKLHKIYEEIMNGEK